ncbi:MucR family transcriptional regulator [Varunaivibrio sulfuroxidans]|uniref:MucR family transcriptional regulator n=1 Tax=Varunaivibrio sulfuroxidans TaxID=1773489 RepID=UPI0010434A09|nr:MucR family transcriptional regulator [Varunaivibrio sulfuroxidans]WES31306.1 MucR family transcriptional regulator [Varunaivibrio sulfuroxidans]
MNEKVTPPDGSAEALNDIVRLTADIVAAYVGQNQVPAAQIPDVIKTVHTTLTSVCQLQLQPQVQEQQKPAVPVRRSITPDFIICLEDGKKLKMLKRHLRTAYGMTPEDYRAKWNLAPDYPMVAPNYAKRRSDFAKKIGLGQQSAKGALKK